MTDSCTVARTSGTVGALNTTTLARTGAATTDIYSGPCRVRSHRLANPRGQDVGGDVIIAESLTLSFPWDAPRIAVQDIVTLTGATYHPDDVPVRFRITSTLPESQATAQRCQAQVIIG